MNCADLQPDAIADLVEGRLDARRQRDIERHLEGCAHCRALVEDLRTVRASAFMLDRREPKAETLARLQAAIAAEPASGVHRRAMGGWPVWLGAAAALILATVIGVMPLLSRPQRQPGNGTPGQGAGQEQPATVESVAAEFAAAEKH